MRLTVASRESTSTIVTVVNAVIMSYSYIYMTYYYIDHIYVVVVGNIIYITVCYYNIYGSRNFILTISPAIPCWSISQSNIFDPKFGGVSMSYQWYTGMLQESTTLTKRNVNWIKKVRIQESPWHADLRIPEEVAVKRCFWEG